MGKDYLQHFEHIAVFESRQRGEPCIGFLKLAEH
jgi:hypothetical protein